MQTDEEILTEQGKRDFRRAAEWCILSWSCLLVGFSVSVGLAMLRFESLSILGAIVAGTGVLFSLYAAFLSLLGMFFPGKTPRIRFALLLVVSAFPFLALSLLFLGIHPT